jgi:thiol-disulfide isomerase/thioredoxin
MAGQSIDLLSTGDEAPAFELDGAGGGTYALADFADHDALLVVFTCNHCPYAKAKIPALNEIAEDYDEVAVVGINPNDAVEYPDDSFDRMVELVESGEIRYDAYLQYEEQYVTRESSAVCAPDPFLFRREDGSWTLAYHGRLDDALNPDGAPSGEPGFEMREAIESVIAGDTVEQEFRPSQGCSIKWKEGNETDYW